jgi:hypothetical protein
MPPKKKASNKTDTPKGKELFDFINMIYQDQSIEAFDNMTDAEKKKYKNSRYMIHRFLSMNPMYTPIINALQQYTNLPERQHYMFLTNMIPKGRQFNKYIKGDKEERYESWLIELVAKYFNVSSTEAGIYLDIYYEHDRGALRFLCEMHGIDSKQLKKAKL